MPVATKKSSPALAGCTAARSDGAPRQRDRRRRQAGPRVGVVRPVASQVARAQVAVELRAEAVDHGRVGLQPHAAAQPLDEYAGDARPLAGEARLLLDDDARISAS